MALAKEKNHQIIEAAILEFQERGFSGTSMDRISKRANVSKRTVYNHFESKDVLFKAINQCLADRLNAALEIPYDPDMGTREQLTRLGWAEGNLLVDPCFMNMARMIMSETIRNPDLAADMNGKMTKLMVFEEFMGKATADGKLNAPDPKLAASQFLALLKSQGFYPNIHAGQPATREEMTAIIDSSVDMILARYGVPGEQ